MSQNVEKHTAGDVIHPLGWPWWDPKFTINVTSEIGGSMMPKIGIRATLGGIL